MSLNKFVQSEETTMRSMRPITVSRFAHQQTCLPCRRQSGFALIVALVLIVALTMVAIVSLRITTLDLQMAKNSVDYRYALNVSEGSRILGTRALDQHTFYRSWSGDFDLPEGISPVVPNGILYINNNSVVGDIRAGYEDLTYRVDVNGNGNTTDAVDLRADIFISRVARSIASGAGAGVGEGYSGLGRGAAGGGGFLFFDVRSRGSAVNNARALTISHYRYVIRS